jgi:hypothetical protein
VKKTQNSFWDLKSLDRQEKIALKDNIGKLIKKESKILELEREYFITLYETTNPNPIKIEEYIEATNIY